MYDTSVLAAYPDSVVLDTVTVRNAGDAVIVFCAYPSGYDATKVAAEFYFHTEDTSLGGSGCSVAFRLLDSENDIEAYAYKGQFVSDSTDPTLCDYSSDHSVLFPGSVGRVVCVGATAYRTSVVNTEGMTALTNYGTDGERARFSSMGPTLSGLMKPDISAPGQNIVSALSSYYIEAEPAGYAAKHTVRFTDYGGRRYPWTADSGTSMSSPVVAGIIALWLQHCPTLTPEQVKDIFAATARRRDLASGYPNNMYGQGEIDALAGLDYIMQHITGIRDTTLLPPPSASSACYDIQGRRVDPARYRGVVISGGRKRLLK
ncbi:MAG: S8 family serine peptidase [Bacteroidales bacterium]|nr:S8 family serine peptidase [Bacteroidales bacterium]